MVSFWQQLKRRRIVQVAIAYIAISYALLEGLDFLIGTFEWPAIIVRAAILLLLTGLALALIVAWYHGELGHQRVSLGEMLLLAVVAVAGIGLTAAYSLLMPVQSEPVVVTAPEPPELKQGWIGVLPFTNLSADTAQDFFVAGMTHEITTALAELGGIRVISPGSTAAFANRQGMEWSAIAGQLGVATLVDGSVRVYGDAIRVNAQLVDAMSGEQLWAGQYDEDITIESLFDIQTDMARNITTAIYTQDNLRELVNSRPTENLDAYEAYLQGLHAFNDADPAGVPAAQAWYSRAIELDQEFALAYVGLADTWLSGAHFGIRPHIAFPNGQAAAEQALALNEGLGDAHIVLADILFHYEWDWGGAEREFLRGQVHGSIFSTANWWYAGLLSALGRHEEAIDQVEAAKELDPLSPIVHIFAGQVYAYAKRFDEAEAALDLALEMNPAAAFGYAVRASMLFDLGRIDEALTAAREAARLAPVPNLGLEAALQAHAGQREAALGTLARLDSLQSGLRDEQYVAPYSLAPAYLALGEIDQALDALEEAADLRDAALIWIRVNPLLDGLRAESRYLALLNRMGLQ